MVSIPLVKRINFGDLKTIYMIRIGHRGAAGHAPENTINSIQKAIDLECDFVEVDVQSTKDGTLVLFHDKLLDRVTNASGYLSEWTYPDLKKLDVAGIGAIPTLDEACEILEGAKVGIMAEVVTFGIENLVVSKLQKYFSTDHAIIASFSHQSILNVRHINPSIRTVALIEGSPINIQAMVKDCQCDYIGMGFESIEENSIRNSKTSGVKPLAWTLDDQREIDRAKQMGIAGIISNFPERVSK